MEKGFKGEKGRTPSGNGQDSHEVAEIAHVGPIAPPEYYSTAEAGQILGIDPHQVRQLLKSRELEGARDPKTGRWRVYQRSVHARVKDHSASSQPASASLSEPTPARDLERQVAAISARLRRVEERVQADIELAHQRADLERRWAELLERTLEAERSKGFFRKLRTVGDNILGTGINNDVNVEGPLPEQEAPTSPQEEPRQDRQAAKKKMLPLPSDFLLHLKSDAVLAQFFITAGASIVAAAVLVISVLNGRVVLAGLAAPLTVLSIVSFLIHWWLFRSGTDRIQERPSIQGRPSESHSEASASPQEEPRQDRQAAKKKKLPLPFDFLLQLLLCAALLFGVVKPFVVEPFYIPTESMVPTLKVGDRVLIEKLIYHFAEPERGNIVVFKSDEYGGANLIKRVVGLPGDKVELRHGKLFLNGQRQNEPYVVNKSCVRSVPKTCSYGPMTVPKGRYFMMGDNRAKSKDSRYFGPIPRDDIKGESFLRLWPPDRASLL